MEKYTITIMDDGEIRFGDGEFLILVKEITIINAIERLVRLFKDLRKWSKG